MCELEIQSEDSSHTMFSQPAKTKINNHPGQDSQTRMLSRNHFD